MGAFLIHIIISAIIFGLMALGFKFFLKLKGTLDFSYIGIIIFAAYAASLINVHRGRGILGSTATATVLSLGFTGLVLYLSSKLSDVYFAIGTLAFYMLVFQLAYNLDGVTGGALGLSGMSRDIVGTISVSSLESFLLLAGIVLLVVLLFLMRFKRTYFFTILRAWGERALVIRSLGVQINRYKLTMIVITTVLAARGGSLFAFYYLYIDPPSFWLYLLILLIIIGFVSYRRNDLGTVLVALAVILAYEYLRFFKIVEPAKIGYMREILIALIQIIAVYGVFKTTQFGREQ